jgi:SAM-dependent methyltransferase
MDPDAERIIGLYRRHASAWAADRGNRLFETAWLDRFGALLPSGGAVLDIGCGSGQPIAAYLIGQGYAVSGVDASPELVTIAKTAFPAAQWSVADMRRLALDRHFDGILAWDSFFHLCPDDQRRMFAVFRRHALPHAALMFTSGPSFGVAIGSYQGETLYHASLDGAEYRALLAEQGFTVVDHVAEDPTCGGHTIWLAQLR